MYKTVDQQIKKKLESIVGSQNLILDTEKMADYGHDEFSLLEIARLPEVVVKPATAGEAAEILRLASKEKVAVTPRGGATGVCGGCIPLQGGIVLSTERMNRILEIDVDNQMAVVEAGVTLAEFYEVVEASGLFFPPHPGEESALIGGAIATNAGGSRAVKYGVIRNYVKGIELVLPSGKILTLGGKVMKNSTGYSLLNLIIGSEGTLGVVTKATIQLLPPPHVIRSLIIPYDDLADAIEAVPLLLRKKIFPMAVEFIPRDVITITEEHLNKKWPVSSGSTYLLIILDASGEEEMDRLSEAVAGVCAEHGALDVFVADDPGKQQQVLDIRSQIYTTLKAQTIEVLDIVVPRAEIAKHVKKVMELSETHGLWLPTFGHAADGNVHTFLMKARLKNGKMVPLPETEWREKTDVVRKELFLDCKIRGGLLSAEHGIGVVKKPFLSSFLDREEIVLMKGIKSLFDPHNILNPGKIFESD